jgi:hypothetical protein
LSTYRSYQYSIRVFDFQIATASQSLSLRRLYDAIDGNLGLLYRVELVAPSRSRAHDEATKIFGNNQGQRTAAISQRTERCSALISIIPILCVTELCIVRHWMSYFVLLFTWTVPVNEIPLFFINLVLYVLMAQGKHRDLLI